MTDKEHIAGKPANQAKKPTSATSSKISGTELTGDELDAASGGTGHCATGKHLAEGRIIVRK
jgi:hypothetical protein